MYLQNNYTDVKSHLSHYCVTQLVLYDNEKKSQQIMIMIITMMKDIVYIKNKRAHKTSKQRCQVHFRAKTTQRLT